MRTKLLPDKICSDSLHLIIVIIILLIVLHLQHIASCMVEGIMKECMQGLRATINDTIRSYN